MFTAASLVLLLRAQIIKFQRPSNVTSYDNGASGVSVHKTASARQVIYDAFPQPYIPYIYKGRYTFNSQIRHVRRMPLAPTSYTFLRFPPPPTPSRQPNPIRETKRRRAASIAILPFLSGATAHRTRQGKDWRSRIIEMVGGSLLRRLLLPLTCTIPRRRRGSCILRAGDGTHERVRLPVQNRVPRLPVRRQGSGGLAGGEDVGIIGL